MKGHFLVLRLCEYLTKLCILLWWVDPDWMPGAHQSCSIAPLAKLDRENTMKISWVEIRTGRDLSPISVTGKTDSTWGKIGLLLIKSE